MYLIGMKFFVSLLGGVRNVGNFQWTILIVPSKKDFMNEIEVFVTNLHTNTQK